MRQLMVGALVLVVAGLTGTVRAEEKAKLTGTWKWTVERNGQTTERSMKLKQDGDKLTGTMPGRDNQETAIEDGKLKNGEVSFKVVREVNGNKFTIKYSGKVTGDTIKGKMEFDRNGEVTSRDWEAKRSKE
jgi:hypothetical protein